MDADRPAAATLADAVSSIDASIDAEALAPHPVEPAPWAPRAGRFVQFTVDSTRYAVSETFVTELDRVPKITLVPRSPAWLRGVANRRGDVLSVVDLRAFLGLDVTSPHTGRMLVVRLVDEEMSLGLLVDGVDQIMKLETDAVQPLASPLEGPLAPFVSGMYVAGDQPVAVLDIERLLRSADIRQFDDAREDTSCEAR